MAMICGFILVAAGFTGSQTQSKAYKFAEFGPMSQTQVKKKVDGFLLELAKDPASQGYIINYGTPRAITLRRRQITRSIDFLKYDPVRITFVDGPTEKKIRTQFWIVPAGATPPAP